MIEFTINTTNEFGIGIATRKCKMGLTPEDTFRNALNKLSKLLSKQWFMIEFEFDNNLFSISKSLLHETGFNFHQSVTIEEL